MTTPISSENQTEFHSDPDVQFGTNVGEEIEHRFEDNEPSSMMERFQQSEPMSGRACNVGRTEQKFRLIGGAAFVAAAAFAPLPKGWRIALGVIGAAELVTGTTRYCPLSQALGINTCRGDER